MKTRKSLLPATVLIIAAIVLILSMVILAYKHKRLAGVITSTEGEQQLPTATSTPVTATTTEPVGNAGVSEFEGITKYENKILGYSFYYPTTWALTETEDGLKLEHIGADDDYITITEVSGDSVTNKDTKFGDITYYFSTKSGKWVFETNNDMSQATGQGSGIATPLFTTLSDAPVFSGTERWKTNIVALTQETFIVINMSGSGYTKPLEPFTKMVTTLGEAVDEQELTTLIEELKETIN